MVFKEFGKDIINLSKNYKTLNVVTSEQVNSLGLLTNHLNSLKDIGNLTTDSMNGLYKSVQSFGNDNLTYYFQSVAEGAENARVNIVDAYAAILDGNTHGLQNVQSIMNTFNNSFDGSVEKQKEFTKAVGQSNKGLANYLNSIEAGGTATLKGYAGQLVKTTAQTVGLQVATTALQAAISLGLSLAINALIAGISKAINKQKELREEIENNAESAKENIKNISDLYLEYRKLSDEFITNKNVKDELSSTTNSLLEALGYEKTQIDELTKGYQNLDDAINKATLDSLKKASDSLNLEVGEKFKDLQDMFSGVGIWNSDTFKFDNIGKQSFENMKMLQAVRDAQIENVQFFDETNSGNVMGINIDTSTIDGMKKAADTYKQIIDTIRYNSGLSAEELGLNTTFQELVTRYTNLDTAINNYSSALKNYNDNIAQQVVITSLIGKEIPKTQEAFEQYKQDLINSILSNPNNQFIGTESDIETAINNIIGLMPEFAEFTSNTNSNFDATTNSIYNLVAASDDLQKSLDNIFSNQSIIQSAFDKIQEGSSLSADEVRKLIELCPQLATEFVKTADGYTIGADKLINANDEIVQSTKQSLQERADYLKQFINTDYNTSGIGGSYEAKKYYEWQQSVKSAKTELEGLELVLSMFGITLEDANDKISDLTKSTSNLVGKAKTLSSAFAEQKENGKLSADTVLSLIENGYSAALMYDKETGAIKLNTQAYLDLAKAEIQKQRTEIEIAKNDTLQSKLDAERSIVSNLGWEYLETSKAAIEFAKAKELINNANADLSNYDAQIAALNDLENSLGLVTEGLYGDNFKEKPQSVLDFEEEYARRQHEINMGRMKEDEEYYKWLESAAKTAFEGLADYQDDLYKYEEEVYKGRKQLAEDYYNDRITDLESQIEIATKYSTDKDGNSLNTQEKFDYIRSTYQEILSEIDRRRNEIIQAGLEGNGDILKALEQQYEKYVKEMADIFKDEVESEIDYIQDLQDTVEQVYDDKIDKIEAEKKAMEDRYDAEIDKIDNIIDSLEKENDQKQLALNIAKAEKELAEARRKRNVGVLQANGTISYQADPEAITEAQNNLNELYLKRTTEALEQQKEILQKNKEIESDNYDAKINNLNADKDKWKDFYDDLVDTLNEYLNPKQKESNSNVWNTVAGEDGAVKVGKVEMSTDQIDARIGSEDIAKSLIEKLIKASNDEVKAKELVKNLDLNNAYNALWGNSLRPVGLAELQKAGMFNNVSTQNYVNNNGQTVNLSIGDITITNPVGNSKNLAEELMKKLPNAMLQQIYKVR